MAHITVGVDVGKASHRAAAADPAIDRVLGQLSFDVDRAGFGRFEAFPERLAVDGDDAVRGPPGGLRLRRGLLQHPPPPQRPRLPQPRALRSKEAPGTISVRRVAETVRESGATPGNAHSRSAGTATAWES